jgi:hypothetical protein
MAEDPSLQFSVKPLLIASEFSRSSQSGRTVLAKLQKPKLGLVSRVNCPTVPLFGDESEYICSLMLMEDINAEISPRLENG